MEILNKNGMILMDYRREFKRHYADSVDEALKDAILTLYKEGQIPEKLFRIILDDNIEDSVVYTYLLSRREFTKSSMELNSAFNEVRERVNDYLIKINFVRNVCTKNSINTNRIYVIKQYDIPKDLLLSYFGLTPSEIIPLMKRKGFMDKFCVLRLSQAFKEIYSELRVPEHIDHGYSLIYYNKLIQGFSIDYKYMVNINYINDEEHLTDLMDKIKDLDAIVEKKFESKMSYKYFQELDKKLNSVNLASEIDKIIIPVRSGKRSQDIRKPEFIVEEIVETMEEKVNDHPAVVVKEHSTDEIVDVVVEKPAAKPVNKQLDKTTEKPVDKPVEKPVVENKEQNKTSDEKKEEDKQPEVKKDEPKKVEAKPEQKNNQQQKKQNGQKPQQQPQQQKQQPKVDNKPKQEPKKEEPIKQDAKPEDNKPKSQPQQQKQQPKTDNKHKPEQKKDPETELQTPQVQNSQPTKQQPKVADDDDDDDLFINVPTQPKAKPSDTTPKPTLSIDDSDLDMI